MRSELYFQSSPWLILLCLALGAVYAFLLYQPQPSWSQTINRLLAVLRGALISLIAFLILSPMVRNWDTRREKAKVVLAVDNSTSMKSAGAELLQTIKSARRRLLDEGYEVAIQSFTNTDSDQPLDSLRFTATTTDLSSLLGSIRTTYEGQHLTDVLLISDGIVNKGISPAYGTYPFAIHSVGVGDTIPKRDVKVKEVVANRIAYLGNTFPIQADIVADGYAGQRLNVLLKQGGKVLETKSVSVGSPNFFESLTFTTAAQQKGVQHYTIEVGALGGEFTLLNNRREVYIDVIDGRERILLLALSPHPDIKALRTIIEKSKNYELDLRILSTVNSLDDVLQKSYDLIILHQLPDAGGWANAYLQQLYQKNTTPIFYIVGNQSAVSGVSAQSRAIQVAANPGQYDKVTGHFNSAFDLLQLSAERLSLLDRLPPLSVPFGEYKLSVGSEVVLFQRVGSVETTKPLFVLNTSNDRKVAVLMGEGLWQWRLEEFSLTEKQEVVDELFMKVMQLLSVKEDKRKFRVYPIRSEFELGERVVFQTEIYNDIYEKIYGQEVQLQIKDEQGKTSSYSYTNSADAPRFELSGLGEGAYTYRAMVNLRTGQEQVVGQFIVQDIPLESITATADFALLRQLSQNTGGQFSDLDGLDALVTGLIANRPPDRLQSSEELVELIQVKWLLLLLILLASIEWALRKYSGGY